MKIEILGEGCGKCAELKKNVMKAVSELDIDAEIETTMDPETIAGYHALTLPVLVIDGVPQLKGIKMTVSEMTELLQKTRQQTVENSP